MWYNHDQVTILKIALLMELTFVLLVFDVNHRMMCLKPKTSMVFTILHDMPKHVMYTYVCHKASVNPQHESVQWVQL